MKIHPLLALSIGVAVIIVGGWLLWKHAGNLQNAKIASPTSSSYYSKTVHSNGQTILYYRNPMGLSDISPEPKKDAMGMDYVPVYAGEESSGPTVHINNDKLQKLGVRTERASLRVLTQTLYIVGTLEADERRESSISPKFEGWITKLFVNTTGASVRRGEPLFEVYSPDLISAQQDYRVAVRALEALGNADPAARENMEELVQGSLDRLRNWDIDESDLAPLRASAAPPRGLVLRATRSGVVTKKAALVGQRFMPGDLLFEIADLSAVWLIGNVFEQDLSLIHVGLPVSASFVAYPGKTFRGTITFVSPVLQAETRTAQIRVELPNPGGLLKPAMYGSIALATGPTAPRLAIPNSAILDTGTRQIVLIDRGGGEFEPRVVRIGLQTDGYAEVFEGVAEHETVVVNGNFLIDAESNLRAAIDGLSSHLHELPGDSPPRPAPATDAGH